MGQTMGDLLVDFRSSEYFGTIAGTVGLRMTQTVSASTHIETLAKQGQQQLFEQEGRGAEPPHDFLLAFPTINIDQVAGP